jgi:AcrR family transcriptional regulator
MRGKAARTRSQLIHAAAKAFAAHGYSGANLSVISADAGVSRGALHFHFPRKEALADAVEAAAAERFVEVTSGDGEGAVNSLSWAVQAFAELYRRDVTVRAGVILSCDKDRKSTVNLIRLWEEYVSTAVAAAERGYLFSRTGATGHVSSAIVAMTVGLAFLWQDNEQWLADSTVSGVWNLLPPLVGRMS